MSLFPPSLSLSDVCVSVSSAVVLPVTHKLHFSSISYKTDGMAVWWKFQALTSEWIEPQRADKSTNIYKHGPAREER